MLRLFVLLAGLWLSGLVQAQVDGPLEGFVFDAPTGSFRVVIGSLGSASLGPALVAGFESGSVAPRHNHGVGFREGRCLVITGLGSDHVSSVDVAGGPYAVPESVVWSADGSLAILYSRAGNWIRRLSGLPDAATADPSLDVSALGGALTAVATDSQGRSVAIGVVGETSGVYALVRGLSFIPLLSLAQPIGLSFSGDGETLYVLDRATDRLSALSMADFTSEAWLLGDLEDPIAVAAASNTKHGHGQVVYVAGRNDQLLMAYDPAGHRVLNSTRLPCRPTAILPLGQRSFLLGLRAAKQDPLWSFTNETELAVFFIPASPLVIEEELGQ